LIPCANPAAQFQSYKSDIEKAVLNVMRGNSYILGKEVSALEEEFADYIGTDYAVGVANGTDAIEIALRALGVGQGDEVITVSHTAIATVAAIEATGATAVLVDIEPLFYTLNPAQLNQVFSKKTKAVVAVHIYGQSVDLDSILSFCLNHNLFFIEDASQAHGAKYKGKRLGSFGDFGCFSCYPTKNLGAIGDAGLVTTNDSNFAKKVRMIREYGWINRKSIIAGRNSRLDELQAAILRVKLKHLDSDNNKRVSLAEYYSSKLSEFPITVPLRRLEGEPVFHLFVIQVEDQKSLLMHLNQKGIQAGVHYSLPVHLQPAYLNRLSTSDDMSTTEKLVQKIISLPLYPELSINDADKVINEIGDFYHINSE